ncbi:MAG: GNAT family protein [Gemella sp.]|nr:GNAT family protein [Gemella sp.]
MELRNIREEDFKDLYEIQFTSEMPEWAKLNAPYFNEYKLISYEEFLKSDEIEFALSDRCLGVYVDNKIIGQVTRYWENKDTRWLEIGIAIYDENSWGKGIGFKALNEWIDKCFKDFPEIERVGCTTWSGNQGMMKLAEKLGMLEEARIRKVRYWQGYYYDSMKYGILREEYYCKK